jgi:hypothetical protein
MREPGNGLQSNFEPLSPVRPSRPIGNGDVGSGHHPKRRHAWIHISKEDGLHGIVILAFNAAVRNSKNAAEIKMHCNRAARE